MPWWGSLEATYFFFQGSNSYVAWQTAELLVRIQNDKQILSEPAMCACHHQATSGHRRYSGLRQRRPDSGGEGLPRQRRRSHTAGALRSMWRSGSGPSTAGSASVAFDAGAFICMSFWIHKFSTAKCIGKSSKVFQLMSGRVLPEYTVWPSTSHH